MTYDFGHESSACTKELFDKAGSPRDIKRIHAFMVSEIVERYMREAVAAAAGSNIEVAAKLQALQMSIADAIHLIELQREMYFSGANLQTARALETVLAFLRPLAKP